MITIVNASAILSAWAATMTAIATVMEPVGPDMSDRVPPEHGGEEAYGDRPEDPGSRPQSCCNAERQGHRQAYHAAVTPPRTSPGRLLASNRGKKIERRFSITFLLSGRTRQVKSEVWELNPFPIDTGDPVRRGIRCTSVQEAHTGPL